MGKTADRVYECDPWRIIERGWKSEKNMMGESIFSLANEYMGVRGYAEEGAEADSLLGSYFGGVYEWGADRGPGGYKGIVRRTHHMVCCADFLKVRIAQDGREVRLDGTARGYERVLDLQTGLMSRRYTTALADGTPITLIFRRLMSMERAEYAVQKLELCSPAEADVTVDFLIDGSVKHRQNGRCQWKELAAEIGSSRAGIRLQTSTTDQTVEYWMDIGREGEPVRTEKSVGLRVRVHLEAGVPCVLTRRIRNRVQPEGEMDPAVMDGAPGFQELLRENTEHYRGFWEASDVTIEGDEENQQGIRYCLFQLHQTYRGLDGRHNIGAKGLTGEAYNGHAFWDSETYCLPYYLLNDRRAARSLLMFRYHTLPQAKERAMQLDCRGACYPIATMNGCEACDLWQHASLQMQPSTAVAYAIMTYSELTGDDDFLLHEGAEMLAEISRYVVSRGGWNADHTGFGFWGVMGLDEFHMMVNNNFYTNYMGGRTLRDTLAVLERVERPDDFATPQERREWREISEHIIVHENADGVIEQHDGYFTLPHLDIHSIPVSDFPLYDHWSYDRIYRTDMIKQPDVLMAMFLHPEDFTLEQLRANYDYYEPRCIHESSLSPSIHAILAQRLGRDQAAADFFSFATRMDLDNYNRNTPEGLHLTSIAAAWVTIVYGFGGLHTEGDQIHLAPRLPKGWTRYAFRFLAGDGVVLARVDEGGCALSMVRGSHARVCLNGEWTEVSA